MFSQLVKQMMERKRVTETLKAQDQMEWGMGMNSMQNRATEIVNSDLIFI